MSYRLKRFRWKPDISALGLICTEGPYSDGDGDLYVNQTSLMDGMSQMEEVLILFRFV